MLCSTSQHPHTGVFVMRNTLSRAMAIPFISREEREFDPWWDKGKVWEERSNITVPKNSNLKLKEGQYRSEQVKGSVGNLRRSFLYSSSCKDMHLPEHKLHCTQSLPAAFRGVERVTPLCYIMFTFGVIFKVSSCFSFIDLLTFALTSTCHKIVTAHGDMV